MEFSLQPEPLGQPNDRESSPNLAGSVSAACAPPLRVGTGLLHVGVAVVCGRAFLVYSSRPSPKVGKRKRGEHPGRIIVRRAHGKRLYSVFIESVFVEIIVWRAGKRLESIFDGAF
jgi:hypothetical protein